MLCFAGFGFILLLYSHGQLAVQGVVQTEKEDKNHRVLYFISSNITKFSLFSFPQKKKTDCFIFMFC